MPERSLRRRLLEPEPARPASLGVPLFPETAAGQAERLAYYEARKLTNPPDSILDYNENCRAFLKNTASRVCWSRVSSD